MQFLVGFQYYTVTESIQNPTPYEIPNRKILYQTQELPKKKKYTKITKIIPRKKLGGCLFKKKKKKWRTQNVIRV